MVKGSAEGKINLCKDVEEFLKCYQDEIDRPRQCVVPYISKKFNQIIQVASGGSEGLITEYEQNPQQFCFADDSEPESEDCLEWLWEIDVKCHYVGRVGETSILRHLYMGVHPGHVLHRY